MGIKNVKQHYRIGHIVQMQDKGICIGSPYVSDLITIQKDGELKWGTLGPSRNDDLARYFSEMSADKATLIRLMETPDTFTASIPVYTYEGAEILERRCEEPGWPNTTHEGEMMYENQFSTDKSKVVEWAKRNAESGVEWRASRIAELQQQLSALTTEMETCKSNRAKLETDYPSKS